MSIGTLITVQNTQTMSHNAVLGRATIMLEFLGVFVVRKADRAKYVFLVFLVPKNGKCQ